MARHPRVGAFVPFVVASNPNVTRFWRHRFSAWRWWWRHGLWWRHNNRWWRWWWYWFWNWLHNHRRRYRARHWLHDHRRRYRARHWLHDHRRRHWLWNWLHDHWRRWWWWRRRCWHPATVGPYPCIIARHPRACGPVVTLTRGRPVTWIPRIFTVQPFPVTWNPNVAGAWGNRFSLCRWWRRSWEFRHVDPCAFNKYPAILTLFPTPVLPTFALAHAFVAASRPNPLSFAPRPTAANPNETTFVGTGFGLRRRRCNVWIRACDRRHRYRHRHRHRHRHRCIVAMPVTVAVTMGLRYWLWWWGGYWCWWWHR